MEKLERIVAYCKASVTVTANDHTTSYQTVRKYMADDTCGSTILERACLSDEQGDIVQRCVDAGTVWEVQAYDRTPIGFFITIGSTLDEACSVMLVALGIEAQS